MKNIFKTLCLACALTFGFASCGSDADTPVDPGAPISPEKEVVGTYAGTWDVDVNAGKQSESFSGTLTLAEKSPYVVDVTVAATGGDLRLDANSCPANISQNSSKVYTFYNAYGEGNPMKAAFSGNVYTNNEATMTYTVKKKAGRVENTYVYTFKGTKQ